MIFDKSIYEKFKNNMPLDVLKKHLYDFRQHTEDSDYHFLIGMCMLKMGYLYEAYTAFLRSIETSMQNGTTEGESFRNPLFLAVTLLQAQKYDEAKETIEKIPTNKLSGSELAVMMETKERLGLSTDDELQRLNQIYLKNGSVDNKIFLIFGLIFHHEMNEAEKLMLTIEQKDLYDMETYFSVIEEFYKAHVGQEVINALISKIQWMRLKPKEMFSFLKTMFGTRYYHTIPQEKRDEITQMVSFKYRKEEKILVQLFSMNYDIAEILNDEIGMKKAINQLKRVYIKKKKNHDILNEQALLYLVTDSFKKFDTANKKKLKERIEALIQLNQDNIKYRQYYCDLLRNLGFLNEALEVIKATTKICQKIEKNEFETIRTFHSYYLPNQLCLFHTLEHHMEHPEECPLCFGSGNMPIIKTIAFGHSPGDVFADHVERKIIEVNEHTLRGIVEWQPMNIPSRLVGDYLHSLGAYSTTHEYPKVLVEGETYIFLKMKTEAYKRLASEGYSLDQIDPLSKVFMGIQRLKFKENAKIFSAEGRELPLGLDGKFAVHAEDFVLEIIRAKSPENEVSEISR